MPINFSDSEAASQFLFDSFYFSQGHVQLHPCLFKYARSVSGCQQISIEGVQQIKALLQPRIERFLSLPGRHVDIKANAIANEIETRVRELQVVLGTVNDKPFDMHELADHLVKRDLKYLCHGRPRTNTDTSVQGDPYFSHVCHYGLRQQPTGSVVFDTLFSDFRDRLSGIFAEGKDGTFIRNLEAIVTEYNAHHTDQITVTFDKARGVLEVTSS